MAVRRARSTGSGIIAALVAFVILFVVTLGLTILFYQQREEMRVELEQTSGELDQFVRRAERTEPTVEEAVQRARDNNRSVVQQLINDGQRLRRTVVGDSATRLSLIDAQLAELGVEEGRTVVSVMQDLRGGLAEADQRLEELGAELARREEALDELAERYEALEASRNEKVGDLRAEITVLQDDVAAYREQVGGRHQQLAARLEEARTDAQQEVRQRDNRIQQLQNELASREARIRDLQLMMQQETPDAPDQTREADGRIVDISRGENLVYINLGRQDHIVLGMTFEVFDSGRGIVFDESGELRGKATVEVVDIRESSAAARIVRASRNRPVIPNDLIANLVYDRDREFKFFVFGDFDLRRDGDYSVSDRDVITDLIQRWGGRVIEADRRHALLAESLGNDIAEDAVLPLDTDFIVMGREPATPRELGDQTDPVRIREALRAREQWERYVKIRDQAEALSIPVINQNRFLAMIGYYDR